MLIKLFVSGFQHLSKNIKKGYEVNKHNTLGFPCFFSHPENVYIGSRNKINRNCVFAGRGITVIGNDNSVAWGCQFLSENHNYKNRKGHLYNYQSERKSINIGHCNWFGVNSIILAGAEIGNNCVIGAGSVVRGKFPDHSLIIGNPAKVVKDLKTIRKHWCSYDV